jgi:HD-GYP domain-containing protein (c-di-GMP phosphodiesterase class II)
MIEESIESLAYMMEIRDPYTAGHQHRVADLSYAIAFDLDLTEEDRDGVRLAAFIHDIGKIAVPSDVLNKPGKLTDIEYSMLQAHCETGYQVLKHLTISWPVAETVLQHHERLNGSGYPNGLKEDEIIMSSRILGVADVVEAIGSHRPYRPSLGIDKALEEIADKIDVLYDADVVNVCLRLFTIKDFKFSETWQG